MRGIKGRFEASGREGRRGGSRIRLWSGGTPARRGRLLATAALVAVAAASAALASCAGDPAGRAALPAAAAAAGPRFVLELDPGPHYRATTTWLVFTLPVYPQVACWIEDMEGRYLGAVYATRKGERAAWIGAPKEGRPEALPVWNARRSAGAGADAVSAPTPAAETRRISDLASSLPPGRYRAFLETNRSYDYNSAYTRENSGVAGQPSVVYRAEVAAGETVSVGAFEPVGRGAVDGSDGELREGLDGIDSALELFSRMALRAEG